MIIGRMDRRIEFQTPGNTRDSMGSFVQTWTTFLRVWAQAKPLRASERFSSDQQRESKVYTFLIRYRDGITSDMRIVYNEEYYRISGIAEINRREGLEITAEYLQDNAEA